MTLTLVLGETELELIPPEISSHPAVRSYSHRRERRPSRTILDSSYHHEAMKGLKEADRRGRPDLPHLFLLLGLDSILNRKGALQLLIHTRNDELIRIHPSTRIMRHYPRFVGLMEQLFRYKAVPRDFPLLTLEEGWTLPRVLREEVRSPAILLSEEGRRIHPLRYFARRAREEKETAVVLGGFPKGGFHSNLQSVVREVVSIWPEPLSIWTVLSEVLAGYEEGLGLFSGEE